MARKSETNLVRNILKALETQFGGFWLKTHGDMFTKRGIPDIQGFVPYEINDTKLGLYVAIEIKTPGNVPSKLQYKKIEDINNSGGIAFWSDSVDNTIKQLNQRLENINNKL